MGEMGDFRFFGEIPSSKSIFNRALIVQSYFLDLKLKGHSSCDDVEHMRSSLNNLFGKKPLYCGDGGTTFRFAALRASRIVGRHELWASRRLLQRPQKGLVNLLHQLGVLVEVQSDRFIIQSSGWKVPQGPLVLDLSESSQYASGFFLNLWQLPFDLRIQLASEKVSQSYFELTLQMVKDLGMEVTANNLEYFVPANQKITKNEFTIEADLSSTFTLAAAGALLGQCQILNFPNKSQQPDLKFLEVFQKMGIQHHLHKDVLQVNDSQPLKALDFNLRDCPDLFPVLAVLCSWAEGTSTLFGAPHLASKESNRILKVSELLNLVGIHHDVRADGMVIHGNPRQILSKMASFDPDQDHRMVMAAALLKLKGHKIEIEQKNVINKSFPEFWTMIGLKP
jgi:3-phosphoshikimate 1-carboxyvinyltransferase